MSQEHRGRKALTENQLRAIFAKVGRTRQAASVGVATIGRRISRDVLTGYDRGRILGHHTSKLMENPLTGLVVDRLSRAVPAGADIFQTARVLAGPTVHLASTLHGAGRGAKTWQTYDWPTNKALLRRALSDNPQRISKRFPNKAAVKRQSLHYELTGGKKLGNKSLFGEALPNLGQAVKSKRTMAVPMLNTVTGEVTVMQLPVSGKAALHGTPKEMRTTTWLAAQTARLQEAGHGAKADRKIPQRKIKL